VTRPSLSNPATSLLSAGASAPADQAPPDARPVPPAPQRADHAGSRRQARPRRPVTTRAPSNGCHGSPVSPASANTRRDRETDLPMRPDRCRFRMTQGTARSGHLVLCRCSGPYPRYPQVERRRSVEAHRSSISESGPFTDGFKQRLEDHLDWVDPDALARSPICPAGNDRHLKSLWGDFAPALCNTATVGRHHEFMDSTSRHSGCCRQVSQNPWQLHDTQWLSQPAKPSTA
jgi:hypothetical protein